MISHIEIRNYQSLHHVDIDLAPLTVIIGRTGSGKSALTRAIQTLTSNSPSGNKFITHGERLSVITAKTDKGTLILKRGVNSKDNEYIVIPEEPSDKNYPQKSYTKLDGKTPPEVSEFLGIDAKDPINYAGQFDMPYLLKETAGSVAKTLGELTNVHIVFKAAAKSKAITNSKAALARTRKADLEEIKARVQEFRTLKEERAALTQAEEAIAAAKSTQAAALRLVALQEQLEGSQRLIDGLATYAAAEIPDLSQIEKLHKEIQRLTDLYVQLDAAEDLITRLAPTVSAELPQLDGVLTANKNLSRAKELVRSWSVNAAAQKAAAETEQEASAQLDSLHKIYATTLAAAGTCPTCGQDTHEIEEVHV